jgi:hypothetical protein
LKAKYYTATSVLEAWGEAKKWDVLHSEDLSHRKVLACCYMLMN